MTQQGFYTDPPSRRMAYDGDGSLVLYIDPNYVIQTKDQTFAEDLNGEAYVTTYSGDRVSQDGRYFVILFPELRDVTHAYRNGTTGTYWTTPSGTYQVSPDTTNGLDGTWTNAGSFVADVETTSPNYREKITSVSATGAKGIRHAIQDSSPFNSYNYSQWHVYGYKSSGETPHRIDFCDHTGAELIIDTDYGDQPRNSSRIWSTVDTWNQGSGLYLKNRSSTRQAQSISISFQVVNGSSDFANYITLSTDNVTFGTTLNIAQMNPQELVGPIYVKHDATINASLGLKAGRLRLTVGTWL